MRSINTILFLTQKLYTIGVCFLLWFIVIQAVQGQELGLAIKEDIPEWLPQEYQTAYWVTTEPGGWTDEYTIYIHYYSDGSLKSQIQTITKTGDTLFRTKYSYNLINEINSATETETQQYLGNNNWVPVSLHIKTTNYKGKLVESAYYTWTNLYAWILESGRKYEYIYQNDNLIRSIRLDYNTNLSSYLNSTREVYYYKNNQLETQLTQHWDMETNQWVHYQRIDAVFDESGLPDSLATRLYIDSTWKATNLRTDIQWHNYIDFVENNSYEEYTDYYPLDSVLVPQWRHTLDHGENGSVIETVQHFNNIEWSNESRLTNSFNNKSLPLEIKSESWQGEWTPQYWLEYTYEYTNEKLIQQTTKKYDTEYGLWNNQYQITYSRHTQSGSILNTAKCQQPKVYPIPAKDYITIEFTPSHPKVNRIIISTEKKTECIIVEPTEALAQTISLRPLPCGVLYIQIMYDNQAQHTQSFKILKLK